MSKVPNVIVPNSFRDWSAPPAAMNPWMPTVSTPLMAGSAFSAFSIAFAADLAGRR